jgi:RHS repeat-associated protein
MILTYIQQSGSPPVGDGGDQYTGLDRFGRVVDQRWIKDSSGADLERVEYGFDRASNRVWRDNTVADALTAKQDEFYTYDGLNQLLTLQRGTLNSGKTGISGTPTWEEDFTIDPTGNWNNYVNQVNGTTTLNQPRTHNAVNEVETISGSSSLMTQNAAGNMSKAPQPMDWSSAYAMTYDAWQRLVQVKSGSTTAAIYAYDGQNRRVTKTTGTTLRHYYYSSQWQILEERLNTTTTADRQFVWGLMALDNLILRDRGSERFYSLQDVFSCTAIVDTTGTIQERYGYNAFGLSRVMTSTFTSHSTSSYDWETRYDNYRYDSESNFYQVRNRYLHPALGRWLTRDPIGYNGGINLYAYVVNKSTNQIDSQGLDANTCTYGEARSCAYLNQKDWPPPANLGDVKESIGATCARNKSGCSCVSGDKATAPQDKAAWSNIVHATGTDQSKGSQYMCVNRADCWWTCYCCTCVSSSKVTDPAKKKYCFVKRNKTLNPTVTLTLSGASVCTINLYNLTPSNGNCPSDEAKGRTEADCVGEAKEGGCPSAPGYCTH